MIEPSQFNIMDETSLYERRRFQQGLSLRQVKEELQLGGGIFAYLSYYAYLKGIQTEDQ